MMSICRLELIEKELKKSHIIPKFAFDYMKSTGSKYLRKIENPDIRYQDGTKEFLLCGDCEQRFSKRERWFANNIFFPYLNEAKRKIVYDENLGYFITSLLWRVLISQLKHVSVMNENRLSFLNDVEKEWRHFLLNLEFPINYNNFNIFFTDRVSHVSSDLINVDLYFTRLIDATIVHNQDFSKVAIYAKFLRFIFWCPLIGYRYDNNATNVNLNSGIIEIPQNLDDDFITSFFYNRIKEFDNAKSPNEIQSEKIWNEILKNEDEFWASDAGKSLLNDINNVRG